MTAGQSDATEVAPPLAVPPFELAGGFWAVTQYPACTADWNGNGITNTSDFIAFLNDFNLAQAGNPTVYGNPDLAFPYGVINTSDFIAFLNAYNSGC